MFSPDETFFVVAFYYNIGPGIGPGAHISFVFYRTVDGTVLYSTGNTFIAIKTV